MSSEAVKTSKKSLMEFCNKMFNFKTTMSLRMSMRLNKIQYSISI